MPRPTPSHATLDDWIAREAIPFSLDSPATFSTAVDRVIASLGDSVELLGIAPAVVGIAAVPAEVIGVEAAGASGCWA